MLPLWAILFETRIWNEPGNITIPFKHIFTIFFFITFSIGIGHIMERKTPKLYSTLWRWLPSFTIFTLVLIILLEIANNYFVFKLITREIFCACILLAISGFIFGFVIAFLCRLGPNKMLVLGMDTGTHTTYFTALLLDNSLTQPEADIAKTAPVLCSILSLVPAIIMVLLFRIYKRYTGKDFKDPVSVEQSEDEMSECVSEEISNEDVVDAKETCI